MWAPIGISVAMCRNDRKLAVGEVELIEASQGLFSSILFLERGSTGLEAIRLDLGITSKYFHFHRSTFQKSIESEVSSVEAWRSQWKFSQSPNGARAAQLAQTLHSMLERKI